MIDCYKVVCLIELIKTEHFISKLNTPGEKPKKSTYAFAPLAQVSPNQSKTLNYRWNNVSRLVPIIHASLTHKHALSPEKYTI
jgi:hypothetical protein